jgi:hypothetical protein
MPNAAWSEGETTFILSGRTERTDILNALLSGRDGCDYDLMAMGAVFVLHVV